MRFTKKLKKKLEKAATIGVTIGTSLLKMYQAGFPLNVIIGGGLMLLKTANYYYIKNVEERIKKMNELAYSKKQLLNETLNELITISYEYSVPYDILSELERIQNTLLIRTYDEINLELADKDKVEKILSSYIVLYQLMHIFAADAVKHIKFNEFDKLKDFLRNINEILATMQQILENPDFVVDLIKFSTSDERLLDMWPTELRQVYLEKSMDELLEW